ncbi:uncharacterized protein CC84DRAFT_1177148 [Paraphaeosphaeria sporulosa]|uniref:Phospholipase/carboxylesterase/thioesterase domain-containing protein n=1 Tax=Paraphaeosphaeria sporulosa TaxID=1460663 RepID=A0A177CE16_9PLEO|nr:uncharacterized protein CC84DRAFT_1177148 [Paraphaeosphaeria sporulosa]OAG05028.1 hypothetical protein CC84DRAFT_1177148 [Paraphaeosphaeria sporulosa]
MDFLPPYIVDPTHGVTHSQTVILLHGRMLARCGAQFSKGNARLGSTVSLDDLSSSQDHQLPGLRDGHQLTAKTIENEVDKLDEKSDRVILGGFSQRLAVALWSLFTGPAGLKGCLGAFVGLSAWMPFAKEAMAFIAGDTEARVSSRYGTLREGLRRILEVGSAAVQIAVIILVHLGHGPDDVVIGIENCYWLSTIFTAGGAVIDARKYIGAGQEGTGLRSRSR